MAEVESVVGESAAAVWNVLRNVQVIGRIFTCTIHHTWKNYNRKKFFDKLQWQEKIVPFQIKSLF